MNLFTLFNVFSERDNLARAISSVDEVFGPRVDAVHHVFIDGAYPDYASDNRLSADGTMELAMEHGHLLLRPDTSEVDKRNAGLSYVDTKAADGDYVLYLDADETITSLLRWPERVGYFSFTRKTDRSVVYGRCRLYRWEPGLHFKHRHYDLYDASEELVSSLESAPKFDVVGAGDHFEKPRTKSKQDYYRWLRQHEASPWVSA